MQHWISNTSGLATQPARGQPKKEALSFQLSLFLYVGALSFQTTWGPEFGPPVIHLRARKKPNFSKKPNFFVCPSLAAIPLASHYNAYCVVLCWLGYLALFYHAIAPSFTDLLLIIPFLLPWAPSNNLPYKHVVSALLYYVTGASLTDLYMDYTVFALAPLWPFSYKNIVFSIVLPRY